MNKHIEIAKKWLADNDSVSLKELEAATDAAWVAYEVAARAAKDDYEFSEAEAYAIAFQAAKAAEVADRAVKAVYWVGDADGYVEYCKNKAIEAVEEYEELTK